MKKERPNIDQALCNHARILIAGGATTEMAADMLDIGQSTLQKIRRAGFDAEKYTALKQQEKERMARAAQVETSKEPAREKTQAEEQCPGQMRMELEAVPEEPVKQYRFQAAMVDRIVVEMDKINNTLSMILRAMRKE